MILFEFSIYELPKQVLKLPITIKLKTPALTPMRSLYGPRLNGTYRFRLLLCRRYLAIKL